MGYTLQLGDLDGDDMTLSLVLLWEENCTNDDALAGERLSSVAVPVVLANVCTISVCTGKFLFVLQFYRFS